jgi:hypothetical protein
MTVDDVEAAVHGALTPSWAEIVRAKHAQRALLEDGRPHGIRTLQTCLHAAEDVPLPDPADRLRIGAAIDIPAVITAGHPVLAGHRLALAGTEAVLDLAAQGLLVEVADPPDHGAGHPVVSHGYLTITVEFANRAWGIRHPTELPALAAAYRLAPGLVGREETWFLDVDLFTADLDRLQLDARTRRCITEAIAAYRRGLFLACTNLLGAASEGAWYAAGEQLRDLDPQLPKVLAADETTKVVRRVCEVLRQSGRLRASSDELQAHVGLLRQLRNYGVHPRAEDDSHLERYFTDPAAAVLVMQTHGYLVRLADAVAARLADETQ